MSQQDQETPPAFRSEVVYQLPYQGKRVQGLSYGEGCRQFDICYPEPAPQACPAVLLVLGFADPLFQAISGRTLKDSKPYRSWARLIAAHGMAAITYCSEEPVTDSLNLLHHLQAEAGKLRIDADRIGLWSVSGNVPNAIHMLNREPGLRCAALSYGYMLDIDRTGQLRDAARRFGFVNPNKEGSDSFPGDTPLLVVKAGQDDFDGINEGIDAFLREGRARNSPLEFIEYPEGEHSFDLLDASEQSVAVVKRILKFLSEQLLT